MGGRDGGVWVLIFQVCEAVGSCIIESALGLYEFRVKLAPPTYNLYVLPSAME